MYTKIQYRAVFNRARRLDRHGKALDIITKYGSIATAHKQWRNRVIANRLRHSLTYKPVGLDVILIARHGIIMASLAFFIAFFEAIFCLFLGININAYRGIKLTIAFFGVRLVLVVLDCIFAAEVNSLTHNHLVALANNEAAFVGLVVLIICSFHNSLILNVNNI